MPQSTTPAISTSDSQPDTILSPTLRTPSEHEEQLLQFFALHRIATPYNIMDAFPHWFTYHQRVIRHLNWLTNKGYLQRHNHGDGYVYNITNAGYERCRDIPTVDLTAIPYRYRAPKLHQVDHELLITKCAVAIYQYVRNEPTVQLLQEGRFMLSSLSWRDEETGELMQPFELLIPDYWYLVKYGDRWMIRFVEVIAGEESMTQVRRMFAEYRQWGQRRDVQQFLLRTYAKWGAKQPQPEFQVHCILESRSWKHTDAWKERQTMMQTFHVDPMMQGRVWTTTKEKLENALAEGRSINHNIWYRGRDLLGDKRKRWENAREGTRTLLIDEFIRRLDKHPLFA